MGKFNLNLCLETQNLPRLNHEELENVKTTNEEIESLTKNFLKNKILDPMTSPVNSTKQLKKN